MHKNNTTSHTRIKKANISADLTPSITSNTETKKKISTNLATSSKTTSKVSRISIDPLTTSNLSQQSLTNIQKLAKKAGIPFGGLTRSQIINRLLHPQS